MAQLTQADQAQLKARGLYMKERCDREGCKSLIAELRWLGRSSAIFCSRECRDAEEPMVRVKIRTREEQPIDADGEKPRTVKPKTDKLLGIAPLGTALEKVLSAMLDEKWHTKDSFKKLRVKTDDSIGYRLTLLEQKGAKAERPFKLEINDDKVRLDRKSVV